MQASTDQNKQNIIVFGGCGFIGIHLAEQLLEQYPTATLYLADIRTAPTFIWPNSVQTAIAAGQIQILEIDVRQKISNTELPSTVAFIVNLAAVHKQPGHERHEYFDTNIPGAENVCAFAETIDCKEILFTSSIAVYGIDELNPESKNENSIPKPVSPYGQSKLTAESVHSAWANNSSDRRLIIARPGVIFGHGEGGNVTRMVKAVLHRYFVYIGNEKVRKAGGYVKELCRSMLWAQTQVTDKNILLYNFTMSPAPTIEDYATEISKVAGIKKFVPKAPYSLLYWTAYIIGKIGRLFGIHLSINHERITKLKQANNIEPDLLLQAGYQYQYNLHSALQDWKNQWPEDWK